MVNYLVVGAETVVGANLAAYLTEHLSDATVDILSSQAVSIAGCRSHNGSPATLEEAAQWIGQLSSQHVVLCGPAALSSWETDEANIDQTVVQQAAAWAAACQSVGVQFTFVSSDAVFTGPWMFHEEDSTGKCPSAAGSILREAEQQVLAACPEALVVRTNAFGWSPRGEAGWIERQLQQLRTQRFADQDFVRHATPILATDLAGILVRAWSEGLSGVHHIAGAERISPLRFVQRLAEQYQLPWLSLRRSEALQERAVGFGAGECSLQTKRIRKAVCVAMPMISESLGRLVEQDQTGFRAKLCQTGETRRDRVA
ncbi:MAG: sugar nucleotide-binding protein [Planctomycetaceae bacterium]|nr:sugar nucleotide-binding protein [Planctomycetaceae bacterium]